MQINTLVTGIDETARNHQANFACLRIRVRVHDAFVNQEAARYKPTPTNINILSLGNLQRR